MGEQGDKSKPDSRGPESPDGVDGLPPTANAAADDECDSDESDSDGFEEAQEDDLESDSDDDDDFEEAQDEETDLDALDPAALLALTKSRLAKTPQPAPPVVAEPNTEADGDEEDASDDSDSEENAEVEGATVGGGGQQLDIKSPVPESPPEEKKSDADAAAPPVVDEPVKDQAYYIELAMKKSKEAEIKAAQDDDPAYLLAIKKTKEAEVKAMQDNEPAYLLKLAEKKVEEANAKAKEDEEATGENVIKPVIEAKPTRGENSELWALLNYSKMRLETGATPQVGGGKKSGSKSGSVRGDDNMSVSSKLSKSSKRSLGSRRSISKAAPISVVGGPGDLGSPLGTPQSGGVDVTDNGDDSVGGSVSLESEKNNSVVNENESDDSDDEDEDSSDDESEEEEDDALPDFLKDNDEEEFDPEEAKAMYEAAKFKAASILSVSEDKLTDVQMLQAIAIAEEAARKGDEKFTTKRSLFKLNEAKIEDLKSFLSLSSTPKTGEAGGAAPKKEEVGWGIGRGRLVKKLGAVVQDFKGRCEELDNKKQQERAGQPSNKEMLSAAMLDLKAQIEEYEKIVTKKG
ncbi:hypothetical protein ACHAXR_010657 [Thalassiosira sp. AJA248-18]